MISFVESGGVLDFKFSLANLSKQAKKYYTSTSPQLNHKKSLSYFLYLDFYCFPSLNNVYFFRMILY